MTGNPAIDVNIDSGTLAVAVGVLVRRGLADSIGRRSSEFQGRLSMIVVDGGRADGRITDQTHSLVVSVGLLRRRVGRGKLRPTDSVGA